MSLENSAKAKTPMARLNLPAIEQSLRTVQANFDAINHRLSEPRAPLTDEVLMNMLAGYRFIDRALAGNISLLEVGQSTSLLELNKLVLFGENHADQEHQAAQVKATHEHFYQLSAFGGIGELLEWLQLHEHKDIWWTAAGLYIHVLSQPQLFIEGNHRTGALLMSYLLCKNGKPPFVLSVNNAQAHFDPSSLAKGVHKHGVRSLLLVPKIKKRLAKNLRQSAVEHYLHI